MGTKTLQVLQGLKGLMDLAKLHNCTSKYNGEIIQIIADDGYYWDGGQTHTKSYLLDRGAKPEELIELIQFVIQDLKDSQPKKQ
jgi:hypothetical protein